MAVSAIETDVSADKNFPIESPGTHHMNLSPAKLYEFALKRGEAQLAQSGALCVATGQHTGRSATDKFLVRDQTTDESIWWDNNQAMSPEAFDRLYDDFLAHASGRDLFVQELHAGADPEYQLRARVYCELSWHSLFIRNLLIRPERNALDGFEADLTIVNLPSFRADPERHGSRSETVIACNFSRRLVLIGGTSYAGETKKSVFGYLNYMLPAKGVMPMHCSANVGDKNDTAVFFGLSGTGKTTLSADPVRTLLGDDEHGWSDNGIYNFEGGCYAKTIRLSQEAEPEIYSAVNRFGAVLENVVLDARDHSPDFDDGTLTENARGAYPLDFIPNASATGTSGHPKNIVMLTADAFGVLPPIAKLNPAQAMYHFLSGYTAKVAGTEKGVEGVQATFSTCFGAPFMPRHPSVYGDLLRQLIATHDVDCWLVNTGWTGGNYGVGSRMPIGVTRKLLSAALSGELATAEMRVDPIFGFSVPVGVDGVDAQILTPRETWHDASAYDAQARALVDMFRQNFAVFAEHVDADVREAGPATTAL